MATRLIGTDTENPRLPDVVIQASQGTTDADLAPGDTLTQAQDYTNATYAELEARVALLEQFIIYPVFGQLDVEQANHAHVASSPTLIVAGAGTWTLAPNSSSHAHTATGDIELLPEGPVEFTLTPSAVTFQPWVDLLPGSTATVSWYTSADVLITTGLTPSIAAPTDKIVKMLVTDGGLPAMNEVEFLNLGFNNSQDNGRDSLPASLNWPGQPVLEIAGLQLLTGMTAFMAANTPLRSVLNLTGMDTLEYVECFGADIPTLTLTGCTSLIRICVEGCAIGELDLSPVKDVLRDLRCAVNLNSQVEFVSDGPMSELWHYCVRDQIVTAHLPGSQLPVVEEYWVYGTNMQDVEVTAPTSTALSSCRMGSNPLFPQAVDRIFDALDTLNHAGGLFESSEPNSPAGDTDRAAVVAQGWTVDVPTSIAVGTFDDTPTHGIWVDANLTALGTLTKGVTAGVLSYTNNAYGRIILNPAARSAGPVFFEVAVDRSDVDPTVAGNLNWVMITNCDASGNGGLRTHIQWPTRGAVAQGIQFGQSNTASSSNFGIAKRINYDPAGWTNAGAHKVGLYHCGSVAMIYLDGTPVYRLQHANITTFTTGGYVGVGGDADNTTRSYTTWGLSTVTPP